MQTIKRTVQSVVSEVIRTRFLKGSVYGTVGLCVNRLNATTYGPLSYHVVSVCEGKYFIGFEIL